MIKCLSCQSVYEGDELREDIEPTGERWDSCPSCGSSELVDLDAELDDFRATICEKCKNRCLDGNWYRVPCEKEPEWNDDEEELECDGFEEEFD